MPESIHHLLIGVLNGTVLGPPPSTGSLLLVNASGLVLIFFFWARKFGIDLDIGIVLKL